MESLVVISFLVCFASINGQDFDDLSSLIGSHDEVDQENLLPEENYLTKEQNFEFSPETTRARRVVRGDHRKYPILEEINKLKEDVGILQAQYEPYKQRMITLEELSSKLERLNALVKMQQAELDTRRDLECSRRVAVKRRLLPPKKQFPIRKKFIKPFKGSREFVTPILLSPNLGNSFRKIGVAGEINNVENNEDSKKSKPKRRAQAPYFEQTAEEELPEPEKKVINTKIDMYATFHPNKSKLEADELEILRRNKNTRCLKTETSIICSAPV